MSKVGLTKSEREALEAIEDINTRKAQRRDILKSKRDSIDLSKYVKGTPLYARAIQMKYGLPSAKEIRIKEQRKLAEGIKNLSKENPLEYFQSFVNLVNQKNINVSNAEARSRQITSGQWLENKELTFKDNYIQALNRLSMDKKIIDEVKKLSSDEIRFTLPEIQTYYVPNVKHKIRRGRNYHLDSDLINSDSLKSRIIDGLEVATGRDYTDLKDKVLNNGK